MTDNKYHSNLFVTSPYPLQRRGWSRGRRCWGSPGSRQGSRARQRRGDRVGSRRRFLRWRGRRRTRARTRPSPPGPTCAPRPPPMSGTGTPSVAPSAVCSPARTAVTMTTRQTRTALPEAPRTQPSPLSVHPAHTYISFTDQKEWRLRCMHEKIQERG